MGKIGLICAATFGCWLFLPLQTGIGVCVLSVCYLIYMLVRTK